MRPLVIASAIVSFWRETSGQSHHEGICEPYKPFAYLDIRLLMSYDATKTNLVTSLDRDSHFSPKNYHSTNFKLQVK